MAGNPITGVYFGTTTAVNTATGDKGAISKFFSGLLGLSYFAGAAKASGELVGHLDDTNSMAAKSAKTIFQQAAESRVVTGLAKYGGNCAIGAVIAADIITAPEGERVHTALREGTGFAVGTAGYEVCKSTIEKIVDKIPAGSAKGSLLKLGASAALSIATFTAGLKGGQYLGEKVNDVIES